MLFEDRAAAVPHLGHVLAGRDMPRCEWSTGQHPRSGCAWLPAGDRSQDPMKKIVATAGASVFVFAVLTGGAAQAKSVGSCPTEAGFALVTVLSLGITPELSEGYPSLDGNGDGLTCIKPVADGKWTIFRDNTVGS